MIAKVATTETLMIPGPTPVPPDVLAAMNAPMINHRGPQFASLYQEIIEGVRYAYQTKNDVFLFPASGTGGMEAAVVNMLSPGDRVVVLNIGAFGARFVKIAKAYGAEVHEIRTERGKAVDLNELDAVLAADSSRQIKAVLFQQNETSTGVLNPVKEISERIERHGALKIVDAVSGLLAADLKTDEWKLDVVVSGSQKAFMVPPGLALVSVSSKAWEAYASARMPRFYWDFKLSKNWAEKGQTPVTPPLSVYYGLRRSLQMIREKGISYFLRRHQVMRNACRKGLRTLGLALLAEEGVASPAVTAVFPPAGVSAEEIRKMMRTEHQVILAGGQEELQGKIFRIGHLGYVRKEDLLITFTALERVFSQLGYLVKGTAVSAVDSELQATTDF